jgi:cytochrome P450
MLKTYKENNLFTRSKEFLQHPGAFIAEKNKTYGESFYLHIPLRTVICTADPNVVKHVLQTNQKNYRKSFAYKQMRLALGMGLVTSEGEFWRKQRRMIQPTFYKTQLEDLFKGMFAETENYVEALEARRGSEIDISQEMMHLTSNVVLRTLFSSDNDLNPDEVYEQMVGAQEYMVHRINNPLLIPFNYINGRHKQFLKDKKAFNSKIYELIDSRKVEKNPPNDLLTMLISAKDENGEGMSNEQLRDEAVTIFAAGHETSANALAWTFYLLSQHPEVVRKLRQELDEVLEGRTPKFGDLRQLQYTKQVIEEGMRLYPPAHAVGREAIEDDEINGEKVKKDTIVLVSIYALHRSEKYYENPEKFDPGRFTPERVKARPKNAYLPFGAGPRMCIGNHFAMMEMQLILASIVQKFDFSLAANQNVEMSALLTLKPKENIRLQLT